VHPASTANCSNPASTLREQRQQIHGARPPSQTWRTFLDNHLTQLVSIDFRVEEIPVCFRLPLAVYTGSSFRARLGLPWRLGILPPQSGRTEARTGLRMMPKFPPPPLSFRTVGFPRYGWKAGISDGIFPMYRSLKPAPSIRQSITRFISALRAPPKLASLIPHCVGPTSP
jgi:hypothetical protein